MFEGTSAALADIGRNKIVIVTATSWAIAQTLKVVIGVFRERRFNFRWFAGSGGMPSSHAALVTALAASIGISQGFETPHFGLALGFMVITMFDAQGVRRQSGEQAEALNKILEDLYAHRDIEEERLKELFGHTPSEVFVGGLIGILVSLFCYR